MNVVLWQPEESHPVYRLEDASRSQRMHSIVVADSLRKEADFSGLGKIRYIAEVAFFILSSSESSIVGFGFRTSFGRVERNDFCAGVVLAAKLKSTDAAWSECNQTDTRPVEGQ